MRDKAVAYKAVLAAALLAIAFSQRAWLDFSLVLVTTALVLASRAVQHGDRGAVRLRAAGTRSPDRGRQGHRRRRREPVHGGLVDRNAD